MERRPWIISGHIYAALVAVMVAYAIAAMTTGMSIFELRGPGRPQGTAPTLIGVSGLLIECALIWVALVTVSGWLGFAMRRRAAHHAAIWPILVVPALLVTGYLIIMLWEYLRPANLPPGLVLPNPVLPLLGVIGIFGVGPGLFLWGQARLWRKSKDDNTCHECDYDLRGTMSDRCPECGTQLAEDRSKEPPGDARSFPELLLFPSYEARRKAWDSRAPASKLVGVIVLLMLLIWFAADAIETRLPELLPSYGSVAGLAGMVTVLAVYAGFQRRRWRHDLRRRLRAEGISVCMKCGADLSEVKNGPCPACGALDDARA